VKRVLLGSAGTGNAFAAISSLRRVWSEDVFIVAADINPPHLVTASLLANTFIQVPLAKSGKFRTVLPSIIDTEKIDTYLPVLPEEILFAAQCVSDNSLAGVSVLVPPLRSAALCADKFELANFLKESGLPTPRTTLANDPFSAPEYFVKPRNAFGSKAARKISAAELARFAYVSDEWVVQEICSPPEITVDAFYAPLEDFVYAICRERLAIKAGVCTKARLFQNDELSFMAKGIARSLQISGTFCFQVMAGDAGALLITDVNPRPGAGTAMCSLTRNDFFAATFAHAWNEDARRFFVPLEREAFVTRQHAEFLMG
jgi:carbamoylphosphate synthase large subunit